LIVISGPSGVGKDSVIDRMKKRGLPFHFVVTATTRRRRPEEINGEDYFFVSPETFEKMIEDDELFEHAMVYGDHKGVPKEQIGEALDSGKDVIMRVDVQGAATIRARAPEAVLIFLSTRDEEELVDRLRARRTEEDQHLQLRIETARKELRKVEEFDYYVINKKGELDSTVDTILAIIEAEHHRSLPRRVTL
jgi:guanylate kinase